MNALLRLLYSAFTHKQTPPGLSVILVESLSVKMTRLNKLLQWFVPLDVYKRSRIWLQKPMNYLFKSLFRQTIGISK